MSNLHEEAARLADTLEDDFGGDLGLAIREVGQRIQKADKDTRLALALQILRQRAARKE